MSKKSETTVGKAKPALEVETHTKWVSGVADNAVAVSITFADGERITLAEHDMSEETRREALAHGMKQKLVDAAAIARNTETGRSATLADKKAAVMEVFERLATGGPWNKVREGAGSPTGGLLLRALAELYPNKTHEQLKTWVEGLSDEQAKSLRGNAKVAPVIARLRAGSVKAEAAREADELLAGLGEEQS